MLDSQFLKSVVAGLKGHPDAVLAFAMAVLGTLLLIAGFEPLIAAGVPASFYILYLLRMWWHDKHTERLAEMEVRRLEAEKGKPVRSKNIRALEKAGTVKRADDQRR
jgi:hypothetical protein